MRINVNTVTILATQSFATRLQIGSNLYFNGGDTIEVQINSPIGSPTLTITATLWLTRVLA
jgi:hypothetical protein